MRALIGLSVLVALGLAGCGGPAPSVPPTAGSASASPAPTFSPSPSTPSTTSAAAAPSGEGRCHTAQLSARLGPRTDMGGGQGWLPLIYTNTSDRACVLRGVPGADLRGPADPNGPVYPLFRQRTGIQDVRLRPGASASARLVVLSDQDGSVGSFGSRNWTPTELASIPPGETTGFTLPWPPGLTVIRQDSATHPGSWIEAFAAS